MFRSVSLCCCLAIVTSTIALAQTIPPGWVDYTGAESGGVYDDSQIKLAIPFDFGFYGDFHVTDQVWVHENGFLHFSPWMLGAMTEPPAWPFETWNAQGSRIVAPMWFDFRDTWEKPAYIYWQTAWDGDQRRFVITWDGWADQAQTQENIFQVQLHEGTNDISFHYYLLCGPEDGSRVGINKGDETSKAYTGFWYDGQQNHDGGGAHSANQQGPTGSLEGYTITYTFDEESGSYEGTHTAVPTPGALIMTLIGLSGGVAAIRRRRASRDQPK